MDSRNLKLHASLCALTLSVSISGNAFAQAPDIPIILNKTVSQYILDAKSSLGKYHVVSLSNFAQGRSGGECQKRMKEDFAEHFRGLGRVEAIVGYRYQYYNGMNFCRGYGLVRKDTN